MVNSEIISVSFGRPRVVNDQVYVALTYDRFYDLKLLLIVALNE